MSPETEISGCLIIRSGKVLLLHREDKEHWEVPGGKVEEDESPTQAAIRKTQEEIGVMPSLESPFFSGEFKPPDSERIALWHCYRAEIEGKPEIQVKEFDEARYVDPGNLDDLDLAPNLEMILPALRKI
jgi:mutator protein MutT